MVVFEKKKKIQNLFILSMWKARFLLSNIRNLSMFQNSMCRPLADAKARAAPGLHTGLSLCAITFVNGENSYVQV